MADLNALAVFAKVMEAGSFSEAARRLKMPISTVSRRVSELEDQLGVRLIERSTRNLRLTELGTEVLGFAVRSSELSETVESLVQNRLADVSGTLRLSAMPSLSDTLLTPLVTAFQTSYPRPNFCDRADGRSYRRRGRLGVPPWPAQGFPPRS
jgi:DNA-binding transcriptional LysR family regulator